MDYGAADVNFDDPGDLSIIFLRWLERYFTRVYITPPVKLIVWPRRKARVGVTPPKVYMPIMVVKALLSTMVENDMKSVVVIYDLPDTHDVVNAELTVVQRNME